MSVFSTTTETGREAFTKQWDAEWLQFWVSEGETVSGLDEQFTDWRQQLVMIAGQSKRQLKRALSAMEQSRSQVINQEALSFLMRYTSACLQRVLEAKEDQQKKHARSKVNTSQSDSASESSLCQCSCGSHAEMCTADESMETAIPVTAVATRNADDSMKDAEYMWLEHWLSEGEKVSGLDEQFTDWRQQMYFISSQSMKKLKRAL